MRCTDSCAYPSFFILSISYVWPLSPFFPGEHKKFSWPALKLSEVKLTKKVSPPLFTQDHVLTACSFIEYWAEFVGLLVG